MVVTDDVVQRVQSRLGMMISDKWKLTRVLGIGGMAAVYAAVHRNQNRVAIKMLHPEQSLNETVRTRFQREGYVANTVDHPGAVRVFDDGVVDGAAYLVMELLEGESLEDRRERLGGRLPVADVLAVCDQLLDALAAAHEKGIIHRDIKPDNLFLTAEGHVKVLDFGIARLRELSHPGGTTAGTFMGTPSFMSPEQARGRWEEVDARSDIWATGATLFYLLTGRLVHAAESFADQLALAAREPAPPLAEIDPDQPIVVAEIVDRALAYRAANRWQSARSMQEAVRAARRLVGPPRTSSIRTDIEGVARLGEHQTLLATPDPVPRPRERRSSGSAVVIVPNSDAAEQSGSTRRRVLVALAALTMVLLVFAGLRYSQVQRAGERDAASAGLSSLSGPEASPPAAPTSAARAIAALPELHPEGSASISIAPAASVDARKLIRSSISQPKATAPAPKASALPSAAQAPSTPSAASATTSRNLLDKRF